MNAQRNLHFIPPVVARLAATFLAGLAIVLTVSPAVAGGRVVWKQTTIQENPKRESWRLDLEIHMPGPPDVAYLPMKFEFEPVALYERSLVDGRDEPQEQTLPLRGQQALIETVDIGFMDAGSGTIQPRTKFTFKITRAHGFEAGEYKVTIKDARNGQAVGTPTTLRLKGENPVVDRRSVVFHGNKKKKSKQSDDPKEAEQTASEEEVAEPDYQEGPPPAEEGDAPPAIEENPGGGCHHGPAHTEHWGWLVVGLLLCAGLVARRHA